MTMEEKRILVIDDEENMRHMLAVLLEKEGYQVDNAADGKQGLDLSSENFYDLILCDLKMPVMDGMTFLENFQELQLESTVIVMSAYGTLDTAIEAMKRGAYDYVSKPFKPDEIMLTLKKAEERERLRKENRLLQQSVRERFSFAQMIGRSPPMQEIFATIEKVADYKTSVLITGESGTGKELIAKAIHYNSSRADKPLVTVNCGAFSGGSWGLDFSGRNRRITSTLAGKTTQSLTGGGDKAGRRYPIHQHRYQGSGGHHQRPR
jgi:two-component system response regulator AtoC